MAVLADFHEVDWLVACPRAEHSVIYQRLFGFRRLAEPRQYFGVKFATDLLAIRRQDLRQFNYRTTAVQHALVHAGSTIGKSPAAALHA